MIRDNHFTRPIISYIRDTKRFLICPRNYRRNFMADMEKDIQQFLLENSSAEYNDIVDYFGTPAELAQLYLDNVPSEELVVYTAKRKHFTRFASAVLILIFGTAILFLYLRLQEAKEIDIIYIEESVREIEE